MIFNEYHFGAWRDNAKKLFEMDNEDEDYDFDMEKYKKDEADNAYNETFLPITTSYYLFLSGTPFRAINSGEFIEDQIYNWTYSDEQRAKENWDGAADNPYAALPRMVMMTYRIPDSIRQIAMQGQFGEFDLNVFFSAKYGEKSKPETARFVYENEVQKWLDLIRGSYLPASMDDMKLGQDKRPPMPFSDTRLLNVLSHTFWFLPNVASCYAMYNLLQQKQNSFYHDYRINVCAGTKAGIGVDALEPVQKSMGDPLTTKTITLSCGKLTTGVTVKPWTVIFMLRNLKSSETYFQAAFRVQSPWTVRTGSGTDQIMKYECYVFDFALDRALKQYCSSQFVSRGMCVDFAIHDINSGNPHCHIMLTMRPLDERGAWAAKSKKEYDIDENGERIRLPSGRYKTHKIDLTGWNDKDNTLLWRKAWADYTNNFLERNGSPERIDHRSNAERGIDEIPTVHMGVAACQMEKKGVATEKGELNRNIQKANRLIREIRAQIGKLKEWIADLFKVWETAPKQPPQSPGLANLLMKYLSVQREKSRKYSQRWQQQHTADELKTIAAAVNYLSEHGISTLDELDTSLSSVSDKAYSIREGMKTAEQRMKELQKLIENGENYLQYKPIHAELKKLKNGWTNKRDKYEEAHRAELTLWNAASRYLHAHLPEGVKTLPISAWEKEYTALKAQREAEYDTLKETRAEVAELQKIRKFVDIALRADQPEQTQSRTKRHDIDR